MKVGKYEEQNVIKLLLFFIVYSASSVVFLLVAKYEMSAIFVLDKAHVKYLLHTIVKRLLKIQRVDS